MCSWISEGNQCAILHPQNNMNEGIRCIRTWTLKNGVTRFKAYKSSDIMGLSWQKHNDSSEWFSYAIATSSTSHDICSHVNDFVIILGTHLFIPVKRCIHDVFSLHLSFSLTVLFESAQTSWKLWIARVIFGAQSSRFAIIEAYRHYRHTIPPIPFLFPVTWYRAGFWLVTDICI